MATIKEAYCSFEVAKLLKEKGFDDPCLRVYDKNGIICIRYSGFDIPHNYTNTLLYLCPTHQMAMAWLREVHNIFIIIEPHFYDYVNEKITSYVTSLWQGDNYYENITSKDYPSYEEAVLGIRIQCHVRHPLRRYGRHTVRHPSMYSPSTLGRPPRKREVTYNGRRIPSNESRKRAACYNSKIDVIWQISTVASL